MVSLARRRVALHGSSHLIVSLAASSPSPSSPSSLRSHPTPLPPLLQPATTAAAGGNSGGRDDIITTTRGHHNHDPHPHQQHRRATNTADDPQLRRAAGPSTSPVQVQHGYPSASAQQFSSVAPTMQLALPKPQHTPPTSQAMWSSYLAQKHTITWQTYHHQARAQAHCDLSSSRAEP